MVDICDLLKRKTYYAHSSNNDPNKEMELLEDHSKLTIDYYNKLLKTDSFGPENMIRSYLEMIGFSSANLLPLVMDLFQGAIYLHDVGKINKNFQKKIGNNVEHIATDNTQHSIYSAVIYIHYFKQLIIGKSSDQIKNDEKKLLIWVLIRFSHMIGMHHSGLNNLSDYKSSLLSALNKIRENSSFIDDYEFVEDLLISINQKKMYNLIENNIENNSYSNTLFWLISKTLFSYMVTSDFYATNEYYCNQKICDFGNMKDTSSFTSHFNNATGLRRNSNLDLINKIKESSFIPAASSINELRTNMFKETEESFLNNLDNNIFYLEAPTGAGKTITSINLAVTAIGSGIGINRVFYVFPFNTLIDQTKLVIKDLFDERDFVVLNSIEEIKPATKSDEDSEKAYFDHIMLHYPMILTSHVNFFNVLTGTDRKSHLMLSHLKNSIVLIDEIQSYKNSIWRELIEIMSLYAQYYNIKFVIMSATLPKLNELIPDKSFLSDIKWVNLIKDRKYYFDKDVFKNRTDSNYDLIKKMADKNQEEKIEMLANFVLEKIKKGQERILVEFISKIDARYFYTRIKEMLSSVENPPEVYELTGDDPVYYRQEIIKRLKEKNSDGFLLKNVLVVATQVIEAGVDIDMFMGFKDISFIDSEEQFAGRINRSCEMEGSATIYFYDLKNAEDIYKNDKRLEFSLRDLVPQKWFSEKDFPSYYNAVFEIINNEKEENNEFGIASFYSKFKRSEFINISKHMKLIDQQSYSVFIPSVINVDGKEIDGNQVWKAFISLIKDTSLSYPQKKVELSKLRREFSFFTYNVFDKPLNYEESLGNDMFLLKKGKYIDSFGKFDRFKYNEENKYGKGCDFL